MRESPTDRLVSAEHIGRKTVTVHDVVFALKRQGSTIYVSARL